jgi:deoxyhypusine monooxygenase
MATAEVAKIFLDSSKSLFERYRALFALRDRAMKEEAAVKAICEGLKEQKSALFRHEVAFVLGQIQSPITSEALASTLQQSHENPMVRHEAAEALGSIATTSAVKELEKYLKDPHRVVKESVEVALDISDYNNSSDFQYAKVSVCDSPNTN